MFNFRSTAFAVAAVISMFSASAAAAQSNYTIRVCNDASSAVLLAISYIPLGDNRWLNEGWFRVNRNSCRVMGRTNNRNFYMYAERLGDGGSFWGGDNNLCVEYPGPYRFYNVNSMRCNNRQTSVGFRALRANNYGTFTWRLTN